MVRIPRQKIFQNWMMWIPSWLSLKSEIQPLYLLQDFKFYFLVVSSTKKLTGSERWETVGQTSSSERWKKVGLFPFSIVIYFCFFALIVYGFSGILFICSYEFFEIVFFFRSFRLKLSFTTWNNSSQDRSSLSVGLSSLVTREANRRR